MKKVLSAILAAVMIAVPFSACSNEKATQTQTNADNGTPTQTETPKELPACVDLRNYNGKNYVTPVKRQLFGDCWAFGIAAASEISYLYANDLGVPVGEVNDKVDFSEKYMAWYLYHSITEDDVILGKVRSSQVGEGYDVSEAERYYADVVYCIGGAICAGSNLFASGFLPIDESISINGEKPYFYSGKYSEIYEGEVQYSEGDDWSLPLNAEYRNQPSVAFFRNSNMLPSPASIDANGEYTYNEEGVIAIKTEIASGHGVTFAALVDGMMNYENWATYNRTTNSNHVVTVVGYDDNYPKENFAKIDSEGIIDEESIPPTDGAFIMKNSNGEYGLDGYFYISYHDHSISHPISYVFDNNDSVTYKNPNYDQYDMLMIGWCGNSDYDSETKMANVFEAEEDENLFAIEYKTVLPDTSVHYEIYKNPQSSKPASGDLLEKGDSTHKWGGYHKFDLNNEYELKKGEKYSIVLTMTYKADDGALRYTDVVPYASSIQSGVIANGVINKGESFLFTDGQWRDICDIKEKLISTAYNNNVETHLPDAFKAQSIDGIAVDNYPIKALLIPKS